MPRQRTLKPEFFRDKTIARLGPMVALVYQALWCWCDDGGAVRIEPDLLKGEAFARWHEMTHGALTECLVSLHAAGRIQPYAVGDELYALIPTVERHSPVNRPSKFRYPRGGEAVTDIAAWLSGQYTHGALTEPSRSTQRPYPSPSPSPSPDTPPPPPARADEATTTLRTALGRPDYLHALEGLLRSAQSPEAMAATLRDMGPGGIQATNGVTWDHVGRALLDAIAAGGRITPRVLRGFIRSAIRESTPTAQANGAGGLHPLEQLRRMREEAEREEAVA